MINGDVGEVVASFIIRGTVVYLRVFGGLRFVFVEEVVFRGSRLYCILQRNLVLVSELIKLGCKSVLVFGVAEVAFKKIAILMKK